MSGNVLFPKWFSPHTLMLQRVGVSTLPTLAGFAALITIASLSPQAAQAQGKSAQVPDVTSQFLRPSNSSGAPSLAVDFGLENGGNYTMVFSQYSIPQSGITALPLRSFDGYSVVVKNNDKSRRITESPTPFGRITGNFFRHAAAPVMGLSDSPLIMPYTLISTMNGRKRIGGSQFLIFSTIGPDNMPAFEGVRISLASGEKGADGKFGPDVPKLTSIGLFNSSQFGDATPQDPTSHGFGAAVLSNPQLPKSDPHGYYVSPWGFLLGFVTSDSSGRSSIQLRTYKQKDINFGSQVQGKATLPAPDKADTLHKWGRDVAVAVVDNSDPKTAVQYPFVVYLALTYNNGINIGRCLISVKGTGKDLVLTPESKVDWNMISLGGGGTPSNSGGGTPSNRKFFDRPVSRDARSDTEATPFNGQILSPPLAPSYVTLSKGPFGDLLINYLDVNKHQHELGLYDYVPSAGQAVPKEGLAISSTTYVTDRGYPLGNHANKKASGSDEVGPVVESPSSFTIYTDEKRIDTVTDNTTHLTNDYLPVMSSRYYMDANHTFVNTLAQTGRAKRSAMKPDKPNKEYLVGIIEGAPPIPAINLAIPPTPGRSIVSSIISTNKSSNTNTLSTSYTTGLVSKWDDKLLVVGVGVADEGDLSSLHTDAVDTSTTASVAHSFSSVWNGKAGANGFVKPEMTLFTASTTVSGFSYDLVDEADKRIPGTSTYYDLFMGKPVISSHTVYMNPHRFIPGDLKTYVRSQAELEQMEDNSMIHTDKGNFDPTSRSIQISWSTSGTAGTTYGSIKTTSTTTSQSTEQSSLSGVAFDQEVSVSVGAIVSVSTAALSASTETLNGTSSSSLYSLGTSLTEEQGITANTDIPGDIAFGGCTEYLYSVYLLKPSKSYTSELLATASDSKGIYTDIWPEDKSGANNNLRSEAKRIFELIDPNSQPWKITYAVAPNFVQYPVTDGSSMPGSVPSNPMNAAVKLAYDASNAAAASIPAPVLSAPLMDKLKRAGLDTPALIAASYTAVYDPSPAVKKRTSTALSRVKVAASAGSTPMVPLDTNGAIGAMQGLNPDEKQQVAAFVKAQQAKGRVAATAFAAALRNDKKVEYKPIKP